MGFSSFINFKKKRGRRNANNDPGRLHVGFRKRDWLPAWYEPLIQTQTDDEGGEVTIGPDGDGTVPAALFQVASGPRQRREPMDGEIVWLPHFALPIEESTSRKERERLQMQFLYDAWRYMNEDDLDEIDRLNVELDNPNHRRWQSWFDEAKKTKEVELRTRRKRRTAREKKAQDVLVALRAEDPDIQLSDIGMNSDTSDDSAYDSDDRSTSLFVKPAAPRSKRKAPPGGDKPDAASKKSKDPRPSNRRSVESDSSGPLPSFHHVFSGQSSSGASSSGKQLPNYRSWVGDSASTRFNGGMDDVEAFGAAQRNSSAPDDPSTNNMTQDD